MRRCCSAAPRGKSNSWGLPAPDVPVWRVHCPLQPLQACGRGHHIQARRLGGDIYDCMPRYRRQQKARPHHAEIAHVGGACRAVHPTARRWSWSPRRAREWEHSRPLQRAKETPRGHPQSIGAPQVCCTDAFDCNSPTTRVAPSSQQEEEILTVKLVYLCILFAGLSEILGLPSSSFSFLSSQNNSDCFLCSHLNLFPHNIFEAIEDASDARVSKYKNSVRHGFDVKM